MPRLEYGSPYVISSLMDNRPVVLQKDSSSNRYNVVVVKEGSPNDTRNWILEAVDEEQKLVKIRVNDLVVGTADGEVFAAAEGAIEAAVWRLEYDERTGSKNYIIHLHDRHSGMGWVANTEDQDEPQMKVKCRPLIVGPSFPPFYPPFEVFAFEPAEH